MTHPNGGAQRKLHPHIRTDGVYASVDFLRPSLDTDVSESPDPFAKDYIDCMHGGGRPPLPGVTDRLVAVDPGRRDMITAVFDREKRKPYVVNTRGFHRKVRTSAAANVTKWALDKADVGLRDKLYALPSSRSLETWASYLRAVLPLLLPRIEALQLVCVRRARFMNYMRRDRELDRICHDLCGDKPTIVAFGAANACSRVWLRPCATTSPTSSPPSRTRCEGVPDRRIQDESTLLWMRQPTLLG